jgi:hypothetical protein
MRIVIFQIIAIQFILLQPCFSQKKIHWKIYDHDFNVVTKISAKEVSINKGLIWYKTGKGFGLMDMHRNVLIKPKYQEIQHYPGGFTSAGIKGCFSMIYEGKEILPLKYDRDFRADTSGYFIAEHGCSENINAYIITRPSIHDKTGKLISQGCDEDIHNLFIDLTGRKRKSPYGEKEISNGFTIKLMPSKKWITKGVYNHKDSLIFSCERCIISDNHDGEFFIYQYDSNSTFYGETYSIDSSGSIKIKANYDRLKYDQKHNRYLYQKGNEHGLINKNGSTQIIVKTKYPSTIRPLSKNRFLLSVDSLHHSMFTICDSLGAYLFAPTKDWFQIISDNSLIRKTPDGDLFTDVNGNPVSDTYDSVFLVPDFNYKKMVLEVGQGGFGFWGGSDVHAISPLDRDGLMMDIKIPAADFYVTERSGKKGLFNAEDHTEVPPQYSTIARAGKKLLAVRKNGSWFTMDDKGHLKSFKKSRYINFFENYILVGN